MAAEVIFLTHNDRLREANLSPRAGVSRLGQLESRQQTLEIPG
jgi:hypothetical protein